MGVQEQFYIQKMCSLDNENGIESLILGNIEDVSQWEYGENFV